MSLQILILLKLVLDLLRMMIILPCTHVYYNGTCGYNLINTILEKTEIAKGFNF